MAAKKTSGGAGSAKKKAVPRKKAAAKKAPPKKKAAAKKTTAPRKKAAPKKKAAAPRKKAGPKKKAAAAPAANGAGTVEEPPVAKPKRRPKPKLKPRRADGTITVAYSPDADDAFMFYALLSGKVDTEDRRYELVSDEIRVLNRKATEGVYDVTAISFGAYPHLAQNYALLSCGASFGDGAGPILVARTPVRTNEVNGLTVAVPGLRTTATLALRLWLPHAQLELVEMSFDEVLPAVKSGRTRAGVLIHERQLTWRKENLVRVVDFGQWWAEKTEGLPLPLGANAIRRDIPAEDQAKIALDIKRSIAYGLGHREETLDYAVQFAKGLPRETVDRYVGMYVNELALDYAERGRQAVRHFLEEARRWDLIPDTGEPEFV
ncbi:MAG: menaquinone biosynthesis family protein [Planctomycetota bacterium]|jgi:1,4-dihydroxy-6-naphthoate synthase